MLQKALEALEAEFFNTKQGEYKTTLRHLIDEIKGDFGVWKWGQGSSALIVNCVARAVRNDPLGPTANALAVGEHMAVAEILREYKEPPAPSGLIWALTFIRHVRKTFTFEESLSQLYSTLLLMKPEDKGLKALMVALKGALS